MQFHEEECDRLIGGCRTVLEGTLMPPGPPQASAKSLIVQCPSPMGRSSILPRQPSRAYFAKCIDIKKRDGDNSTIVPKCHPHNNGSGDYGSGDFQLALSGLDSPSLDPRLNATGGTSAVCLANVGLGHIHCEISTARQIYFFRQETRIFLKPGSGRNALRFRVKGREDWHLAVWIGDPKANSHLQQAPEDQKLQSSSHPPIAWGRTGDGSMASVAIAEA